MNIYTDLWTQQWDGQGGIRQYNR